MDMKLFVYGTLKDWLRTDENAELIGEYETSRRWILYDFGAYPGMIPGNHVIKGEVWEIPDDLLTSIDRYEGHPDHFARRSVQVRPLGSDNKFYDWIDTYLYVNTTSLLGSYNTCTTWG